MVDKHFEGTADAESLAKAALDSLLDSYSDLVASQVLISEEIESLERKLSVLKDLQGKISNSVTALRGRTR